MAIVPADAFIATKTDRAVTRGCPFCGQKIEDGIGRDINFIVHLGLWTGEHLKHREWADYIQRVNIALR
ncbi:MAG: hypothetical protein ACRD6W_01785 [Nitrososphaerales archaeon]